MDIISTPSWAGAWVPPSNSTLMTAFSGKVPATCVEIKFYGRVVVLRVAHGRRPRTPSMRRLLDGVVLLVPHRSTGQHDSVVACTRSTD